MSPSQYVFDQGGASTVTVCRACGWRRLTMTKAEGITAAYTHQLRAHPGELKGRQQLQDYKRREQR